MPNIQHKRGTAAALAATNPVLAAGEVGIETDTLKEKIGDGTTAWNALGYAPSVTVSQISDLAAGANAAARLYLWANYK